MIDPTSNPLQRVQLLIAAAGQAKDRGVRLVYLAEARVHLEKTAVHLKELRWLLDAQEAELARATQGGEPWPL